ncbi:MAG: hypothetical protein A3G20_04010 [Acidobacteria bacterium RIFCSPLOWO2_12_FULL_59_11]|nr:MAG: hypothetical protein A3G20_04010 [Acidobacteria bacterium RIFCSPLOWO2_12_FULL_59_11]
MNVLIQYEGFIVAGNSRVYNFHVIDTPGESRQFTVTVLSGSFRPTSLKFQYGPSISFERLKQELDGETQELHAQVHLDIEEQDIRGYLERHYPRKAHKTNPATKILMDRIH